MKTLTRYESMPKSAKCENATVWWYALRDGIELHVHGKCGYHHIVFLTRKQILEYAKRMK